MDIWKQAVDSLTYFNVLFDNCLKDSLNYSFWVHLKVNGKSCVQIYISLWVFGWFIFVLI